MAGFGTSRGDVFKTLGCGRLGSTEIGRSARANIAGVSFPVCVFCWLGWQEGNAAGRSEVESLRPAQIYRHRASRWPAFLKRQGRTSVSHQESDRNEEQSAGWEACATSAAAVEAQP